MSDYSKILSEILVRLSALENLVVKKNIASNEEINEEIEIVAKKVSDAFIKEKESKNLSTDLFVEKKPSKPKIIN